MSNSSFPSIDKSVIQSINPQGNNVGHELFILREDLIHPIISGNKWRKLSHNVERVKNDKLAGIISYGGAFSNHLLALACACDIYQIPCVLYVRGEELNVTSNACLSFCNKKGAQLKFLSRAAYSREKHTDGPVNRDGDIWLSIPEGGANHLGLKGCMEIIDPSMDFDIIALAQGTTTTSLGVLLGTKKNTEIWGFPVLKSFNSLQEMEDLSKYCQVFEQWQEAKNRLKIFPNYHFAGYAKGQNAVNNQIKSYKLEDSIKFDPIYTAKAFIGMMEELKAISEPKRVLFIHTGGEFNGLIT